MTCFAAQDVTGYPTLKFFKDGPENGVKHRGQRDQKSLEKFINEQMGRAPTEEEVRIYLTLSLYGKTLYSGVAI